MALSVSNASDPIRAIRIIVLRLVLLLVLFYALLFMAVALLAAPYASDGRPIVVHVFDPSLPSFDVADFAGMMGTVAYLLVSVLMSFCIWKLAKRSAQCADYAVSVYFIHFLLTWYIDDRGFPKGGAFYVVLVLSGVVSSLVSERLAMREEMAEIPLDRFVAGKNKHGGGVQGSQRPSDANAGVNAMRIEMV